MAIQFGCEQCGARYAVNDEFAGRKTKCKRCQAIIAIPDVSVELTDDPADLGTIAGLSASAIHPADRRKTGHFGAVPAPGVDELAPDPRGPQTAFEPRRFDFGSIHTLSLPDTARVPLSLALLATVLGLAIYMTVFAQSPQADGLPEALRPRLTRLLAFHGVSLFLVHIIVVSLAAWIGVKIGSGIARDRLAPGSFFFIAAALAPVTIAILLTNAKLLDPGLSAVDGVTAPAVVSSGALPFAAILGAVAAGALLQALLELNWRSTAFAVPAGVVAGLLAWVLYDAVARQPLQSPMLGLAGVDAASRKQWEADHPEEVAKVIEQQKAKETERYEQVRRADPMLGKTDRLMAEVNALRGNISNQFREESLAAAKSLRMQVNAMRPVDTSVVWNELDTAMREVEDAANANTLSGIVPAEVYTVPTTVKVLSANGPSNDTVSVHVFGLGVTLPKAYAAELSGFANRETEVHFSTADPADPAVLFRREPLGDPRQQQPFVYANPRLGELARREKLLGIESETPAVATRAGDMLVYDIKTKVGGLDAEYCVARTPDAWVYISLRGGSPNSDTGLTLTSVTAGMTGKPPAGATDPFGPAGVLARLGQEPAAVRAALETMGAEGTAAAEAALQAAPADQNLLALVRDLNPDSSVLAGITAAAAARAAEARANAVDVQAELEKLRSADVPDKREPLKALSLARVRPQLQEEVASELERLFMTQQSNNCGNELAAAMIVWERPETLEILMPVISNEQLQSWLQKPVIDYFASTKDKKAVFPILRWIRNRPEDVITAISSMGPIAEDEVLKLVGDKDKNVRIYSARILMNIGTKKSLQALQRASTDSRDMLAAATARSALATIKARIDTSKNAAIPEPNTPR